MYVKDVRYWYLWYYIFFLKSAVYLESTLFWEIMNLKYIVNDHVREIFELKHSLQQVLF